MKNKQEDIKKRVLNGIDDFITDNTTLISSMPISGYYENDIKKIKDFISQALDTAFQEWEKSLEGKVKLMGYMDSENIVQMLDEKHLEEIVRRILSTNKKLQELGE